MGDCVCLDTCPFFNGRMASMPAMAEMIKGKYCLDEFESCARHMVFKALGRESVPVDLFPNDLGFATQTLEAAR